MVRKSDSEASDPREQLDAIRSMLAAGHNGIRIERHTFFVWGIAGGLLSSLSYVFDSSARFPIPWRLLAIECFAFLAILGCAAFIDYRFTKKAKRSRDEGFSFVQRQIGKAGLLLLALGLGSTVASQFYGGAAMTFAIWLLLAGLTIFFHGLFSTKMVEWLGGLVILIGVAAFALRSRVDFVRVLSIFVFGFGFPIMGILIKRLESAGSVKKLLALASWTLLIFLLAFGGYSLEMLVQRPNGKAITLEEYQKEESHDAPILILRRGTVIPYKFHFETDVAKQQNDTIFEFKLTRDLELGLTDGKLDGRYRFEGLEWKTYPSGVPWPETIIKADLSPQNGIKFDYYSRFAFPN